MVEVVAMGLLDDDLGLGKAAQVGDVLKPLVVVLGHHAGIADQDARSVSFGDKSGIACGCLQQLGKPLS